MKDLFNEMTDLIKDHCKKLSPADQMIVLGSFATKMGLGAAILAHTKSNGCPYGVIDAICKDTKESLDYYLKKNKPN